MIYRKYLYFCCRYGNGEVNTTDEPEQRAFRDTAIVYAFELGKK
jgi:hypothetical protein